MKKAVVIGASGHVGSYLVPRLVQDGYQVTAITRGASMPYTMNRPEWAEVEKITADRSAMESTGSFGSLIASFRPDVVCDTIAYELRQTQELCDALMDTDVHLIQIGTIWVYKEKYEVPVTEDHPRTSTLSYGANKTLIETYLMDLAGRNRIRATVIQPGHVCGRGWTAVNPQGNRDIKVYKDILAGREILLPDEGQATLHHVHSDDLSALVSECLKQPEISQRQTFHSTTARACTLTGFAGFLFRYFGHAPNIRYVPWIEMKHMLSQTYREETEEHISHSPACSMEKAEKLLGFVPHYNTMETILDSLNWQIAQGIL